MTSFLIVANQTLGGDRLEQEIEERASHGNAHFFVLVPMIQPELEDSDWVPGDSRFGLAGADDATADAIARAHRRSRHRLNAMISKIDRLGGTAEGEVGDPDPVVATQDVLQRRQFDLIIVSTLPAGMSRWLKMDLPSRIDRMTRTPVVTIEAEPGS